MKNIVAVSLLMVLNQLMIVGIWSMTRRDMVFGPIADWLWARLPIWLCKPFFQCMPCMASVYGTGFFFLSSMREFVTPWFWPVHCLALCGAGTMIQRFLDEPE